MISNAREDIQDLSLVWGCITDAVGGQQWKTKASGKRNGLLVDGFFFAIVVALEFDIYILTAKHFHEPLEYGATIVVRNSSRQGTAFATRQTNQPASMRRQLIFRNRAFAF